MQCIIRFFVNICDILTTHNVMMRVWDGYINLCDFLEKIRWKFWVQIKQIKILKNSKIKHLATPSHPLYNFLAFNISIYYLAQPRFSFSTAISFLRASPPPPPKMTMISLRVDEFMHAWLMSFDSVIFSLINIHSRSYLFVHPLVYTHSTAQSGNLKKKFGERRAELLGAYFVTPRFIFSRIFIVRYFLRLKKYEIWILRLWNEKNGIIIWYELRESKMKILGWLEGDFFKILKFMNFWLILTFNNYFVIFIKYGHSKFMASWLTQKRLSASH